MFLIPGLIQEGQMPFRIRQKLVLALSVQIHQVYSNFLQFRRRQQHAADTANVLSACGYLPINCYGFPVIVDPFPVHESLYVLISARVEYGFHGSFFASGTDQFPVGPSPQDQVDGIDNDAFSGACFAGQHLHATVKPDRSIFDQRDLSDRQLFKHVSSPVINVAQ